MDEIVGSGFVSDGGGQPEQRREDNKSQRSHFCAALAASLELRAEPHGEASLRGIERARKEMGAERYYLIEASRLDRISGDGGQ